MFQMSNLAFPLQPEESATSYTSRLTIYVTVLTPFDLCNDLGLDWAGIVRGEDMQLRALAALGGADAGDLMKWAIRRLDGLTFEIGRDVVPNKTLVRSRLRLCPRCVVEDGDAPYRRFHWNVGSIRSCERHNTPLIQLPHQPYSFSNYDFAPRVSECRDIIQKAADQGVSRPFSGFEAYLMRRLRGLDTFEPYPDSLPLHIFCRLSENLGFALLGNTKRNDAISEDDWHKAAARGFAYTRHGVEGIEKALTELQRDPLQSNASHKIDYGKFWTWLGHAPASPEIDAIRSVAREFVISHFPISKGTMVLGQPCQKTLIYSVNSAKQEHRISRKRLVRCLVDRGAAIRAGGREESLVLKRQITAEDIENILSHRDHLVRRRDAAALLGSTDKAFRQLRIRGDIKQHTDEIDRRPMYDPEEIRNYLNRVFERLPKEDRRGFGRVPLPDGCQKLGTSLIGAADLIADGKVRSARLGRIGKGLDRITVELDDLRDAILGAMTPARPKLRAAAYLATSLRTIDYLVNTGDLELIKRGHSLKGYDFPAVSESSLNRFLVDHTTVGRLAKGIGQNFMFMMHALEKSGIESVPVPKGVGRYYLREHLLERVSFMKFEIPKELDWATV